MPLWQPIQGFWVPQRRMEALCGIHTSMILTFWAHFKDVLEVAEVGRLSVESYLASGNEQSSRMTLFFSFQEKFLN